MTYGGADIGWVEVHDDGLAEHVGELLVVLMGLRLGGSAMSSSVGRPGCPHRAGHGLSRRGLLLARGRRAIVQERRRIEWLKVADVLEIARLSEHREAVTSSQDGVSVGDKDTITASH